MRLLRDFGGLVVADVRIERAAARLVSASARISSPGMRSPEMRKNSSERCVCAPHRRSAATSTGPELSRSMRVFFMAAFSSAGEESRLWRDVGGAFARGIRALNRIMVTSVMSRMSCSAKRPGLGGEPPPCTPAPIHAITPE